MTLKLDGWPWNTIGIIFNAQWSCLHDFITFSRYWLKLSSGNGPKPPKSTFFGVAVTLKFDEWPWKTIGITSGALSSYMHDFIIISLYWLELSSGNAEIRPNCLFLARVTLIFNGWPWKSIGILFDTFPTHMHGFVIIGHCTLVTVRKRIKLPKTCFRHRDLEIWATTLTLCMDITLGGGNKVVKFHDDMMRGTESKRCDGQTDGRTDGHSG